MPLKFKKVYDEETDFLRLRLMALHQEKLEVGILNEEDVTLGQSELKDLSEFLSETLYELGG